MSLLIRPDTPVTGMESVFANSAGRNINWEYKCPCYLACILHLLVEEVSLLIGRETTFTRIGGVFSIRA